MQNLHANTRSNFDNSLQTIHEVATFITYRP